MTEKEKAIELVEKCKPLVYCFLGSGMLTNTEDSEVALSNAKKCALICVQELIDRLPYLEDGTFEKDSTEWNEAMADYWQNYSEGWELVKTEIENYES